MNHAVINETSSSPQSTILAHCRTPTDPLLPQLSVILDLTAMKRLLQEKIFGSVQERKRFHILSCEIDRVRHKPESSCMVTYRLQIEDQTTGETGEQILCGRAYPERRSQSQWDKARLRAVVPPRFGKPIVYLPELEMILWSFPNDRKMDALLTLENSDRFMSAILPQLLALHLGDEWMVAGANRKLVQYNGEHTCAVRIDATVIHQATHRQQTVTLFEKSYYNEEGSETYRGMQQLWQSESRRSGQLIIAKPIWYEPSLKTLWQLGLSGNTFIHVDMKRPEFFDLLPKVAAAVASLHTVTLISSKQTRLTDVLLNLESNRQMVSQVVPTCREQLHSLVDRLVIQSERLEKHSVATLHGDLQFENILVDGDQVALIDLDTLSQGDPLFDVGSFVAFLIYRGIRRNVSGKAMESMCEIFIRHYEKSVPWSISRSALRWHIAAALVNERAARFVTRRKVNEEFTQVDDLIHCALQMVME